jgi:low affinity Fe/Cu permease
MRIELHEGFRRFAYRASNAVGSAAAFIFAICIVAVWAITGPLFHFSDAWQLVINTGTTIVTFLMVFVIQNSQNREMKALHLKLDELIIVTAQARNALVNVEELSDAELKRLQTEFDRLGTQTGRVSEELGARLHRETVRRGHGSH